MAGLPRPGALLVQRRLKSHEGGYQIAAGNAGGVSSFASRFKSFDPTRLNSGH
jgi:hypothetical protein